MALKKIVGKLVRYFLQGLLALLPLIVTGYIVILVVRFLGNRLDNILPLIPYAYRDIPLVIIVCETIAALGFFFMIAAFGLLVRTFIGKRIVKIIDSFFISLPGVNTIYRAIKQVVELFSNKKDSLFLHPVLVEYPSPGIWSMGFDTGVIDTRRVPTAPQQSHTVFIPTTPNPTSGFLCVLPVDKIHPLGISTEEAVKIVLTGGIVKR
jgi:uncharacterized membrane protein